MGRDNFYPCKECNYLFKGKELTDNLCPDCLSDKLSKGHVKFGMKLWFGFLAICTVVIICKVNY